MSRRYHLTLAEQETVILWDNELDTASVYTHDQRLINKLKALSDKYPDQYRLERVSGYGLLMGKAAASVTLKMRGKTGFLL